MKKIFSLLTPLLLVAALFVTPLAVQAQVIDIDDPATSSTPTDTTPLPSTGAGTPVAAPETGFAPSENKVIANLSVFTVGGLMGAALGYGIIVLKKKNNS